MAETYDILIIGGGPGGYVAAIRAAQLGFKTAVVEREHLGGICLNWGCIPTKALLHDAHVFHQAISEVAAWGVSVDKSKLDWSKIVGRSRTVANTLSGQIGFLFKKDKVTSVKGTAFVPKAGVVEGK